MIYGNHNVYITGYSRGIVVLIRSTNTCSVLLPNVGRIILKITASSQEGHYKQKISCYPPNITYISIGTQYPGQWPPGGGGGGRAGAVAPLRFSDKKIKFIFYLLQKIVTNMFIKKYCPPPTHTHTRILIRIWP